MDKVIDKIKNTLEKYNEELIIKDESSNCIKLLQKGENRLPIIFQSKNDGFTIYLKGWHKNFLSEEDALDFLAYVLSDNIRLKVIKFANIEYKWILEFKDDNGKWQEDSFAQIPLLPSWQNSKVEYYQNTLLKY